MIDFKLNLAKKLFSMYKLIAKPNFENIYNWKYLCRNYSKNWKSK